ncbi:hypothetical protein CsSME_00015089 [Camellia sinensis var. sinensis]
MHEYCMNGNPQVVQQRVDTNIADGCDALNLGVAADRLWLFLFLKVGNGEDCIPRNGRWNFNKQLFTPIRIEWWEVVNVSAHCDTSHLSRELINCGRKKGLEVNKMWAGFSFINAADSDAVSTEWEVESDDESEEESEFHKSSARGSVSRIYVDVGMFLELYMRNLIF